MKSKIVLVLLASLSLSGCVGFGIYQGLDKISKTPSMASVIEGGPVANDPPIIQNLTPNPVAKVQKSDKISFTVEAFDKNNDKLEYFWTTDKGTLSGSGLSVFWQPEKDGKISPGVATISLAVSDGKGGECQVFSKITVTDTGESQVKNITKLNCAEQQEGASKFVTIYDADKPK